MHIKAYKSGIFASIPLTTTLIKIFCFISFGSIAEASTSTESPTTSIILVSNTTLTSETTQATTTTLQSPTTLSIPTEQTTHTDTFTRMCFQCSASSGDEPCVKDIAGMANSSTNEIYLKDCTASNPNWTQCMVMSVEFNGKKLFYNRDCHDGKYFPTALNSPLFYGLTPNNESTCDIIAGNKVCYTPCNGDFCNGPPFYPKPNDTDPCIAYRNDPDSADPDLEFMCGANGIFDTRIFLYLVLSLLVSSWL